MANKRIDELTNLTSLDDSDLLIAYDVSEPGDEKTKKITKTNLKTGLTDLYYTGTSYIQTHNTGTAGGIKVAPFGAGMDLITNGNGSTQYIQANGDELTIRIGPSLDSGIQLLKDGAFNAYYDGAKKLETTASGIKATNTVEANTVVAGNISASSDITIGGLPAATRSYVDTASGTLQNDIDSIDRIVLNNSGLRMDYHVNEGEYLTFKRDGNDLYQMHHLAGVKIKNLVNESYFYLIAKDSSGNDVTPITAGFAGVAFASNEGQFFKNADYGTHRGLEFGLPQYNPMRFIYNGGYQYLELNASSEFQMQHRSFNIFNSAASGTLTVAGYTGIDFNVGPSLTRVMTLVSGSVSVPGNMTITGDLTVNGTTFTANTETVLIEDNLLVINKNETGAGVSAGYAGIEVERGTEVNYLFYFDENQDNFRVGVSGSLQAVATREDSPTNSGIAYWNDTLKRMDTSASITPSSISLVGHTHDDRYYTEGEISVISGALNTKVSDTSTGHDHDGVDSKQVSYTNLASVPSQFEPQAHGNEAHMAAFITASGVTYTNLNNNGSVGTLATQVAQGDHTHHTVYYTKTQLNEGQLDTRYYTESEVDTISGALNTSKAPVSHAVNASTYGYGDTTVAGHLRVGTGLTATTGTVALGIVPDASISGTYSGFTHKIDGVNTIFSTTNTGSPNTAARTVYGLADFRSNVSNYTGAIVFVGPTAMTNVMAEYEVKIYQYENNGLLDHFIARNYRATGVFSRTGRDNLGSDTDTMVRFALTPAGNSCLILGDVGTVWSYPHTSIVNARFSHTGASDSICSGWTVSGTTSLTGFTQLTDNIPNNPTHLHGTTTLTSSGTTGAVVLRLEDSTGSAPVIFDDYARMVIGHDEVINLGGYTNHFQMHGTTHAGTRMTLARYTNDVTGPIFTFLKSRNTTIGDMSTIITSGDDLGNFYFYAGDSSPNGELSAWMRAEAYGTMASGSIPSRMLFAITKEGETAPTIMLNINQDGLDVAGDLDIDSSPDSDLDSSGIVAAFIAGQSLVAGDLCYMKSDGKMGKADADATTTMPAMAIALETIANDASGRFLLHGFFRDDSENWTVGGIIYTSTTAGAMTQVAPSGANDCVQPIGVATHADRMFFNPQYGYVVIAA